MARLEVFYDFAEPLCYALHERASRWRGGEPAWVPWEREPGLAAPGRPRRAGEQALDPATRALFEEHALPFRPSRLVPSTSVALRAAFWVEPQGQGRDFRDGVFRRLYGRGLESHCHDPEVLAGIVERCGLDPIRFLDEMKEGFGQAELAASGRRARALGLATPPGLLLDGAPASLAQAERALGGD